MRMATQPDHPRQRPPVRKIVCSRLKVEVERNKKKAESMAQLCKQRTRPQFHRNFKDVS